MPFLLDWLVAELDALRERQVVAPVDRVGLAAHVGLPGVAPGLAPAARLLLAAERPADLGARGADVDVGDAAVASLVREERLRRLQASREDRAREPLGDVVVDRDRLVERVDRESGRGSARRSPRGRSSYPGFALHDRRLDVEAGPVDPLAAAEDLAPLRADRRRGPSSSCRRRPPSTSGPIRVVGSSGSPILIVLYASTRRFVSEIAGDRLVHEDPPRRGAALPRRADGAEEDRAQREVQVGVVHHDDRVVAAELEEGAAEALGDDLADPACPSGSSRSR